MKRVLCVGHIGPESESLAVVKPDGEPHGFTTFQSKIGLTETETEADARNDRRIRLRILFRAGRVAVGEVQA